MPGTSACDHDRAMHDRTFKALADVRIAEFMREAEQSRLAAQAPRTHGGAWLVRLLRFRGRAVAVTTVQAETNGLGRSLRPSTDTQLAEDA